MSDYAQFIVEVDWDDTYPPPYDDITNDVENGSFIVGIDDPLKRVANVGTLTLVVDNASRKYSPRNESGPLYGKLVPGRLVRVIVKVEGEPDTVVFTGTIVSIDPGSQRFGGELFATIHCEDKVSVYRGYNDLRIPVQYGMGAIDLLYLIDADVFGAPAASGSWTLDFVPENNDLITTYAAAALLKKTYRWRTSLARANDILIGANVSESLTNLIRAFRAGRGSGTLYHGLTDRHPWLSVNRAGDTLILTANARGAYFNGSRAYSSVSEDGPSFFVYIEGGHNAFMPVDYESGPIGRPGFEYAGDSWTPGETNALSAIEGVVNSAFGYWWVRQDGVPTFRAKEWFLERPAATTAVLIEQQSALIGQLTINEVYNVVSVQYQPRQVRETQVVARASNVIEVPGTGTEADRWNALDPDQAGTTLLKLTLSSGVSSDVGGLVSVFEPVAGTDYTVNDKSDGTGFDYTTSGRLSFSIGVVGNTLELSIGNTATGSLYVQGLQIRGKMLQKSEVQQVSLKDSSSITAYGKLSPLTHALPFPTTVDFAQQIAHYLLDRYKDPQYRANRYEIDNPIADPENFVNHFALTIGDVIQITEYQSATDGKKYMIRSVEGSFEKGGQSSLAWGLCELEDRTYWILDHEDYSRLGETTRLGI